MVESVRRGLVRDWNGGGIGTRDQRQGSGAVEVEL